MEIETLLSAAHPSQERGTQEGFPFSFNSLAACKQTAGVSGLMWLPGLRSHWTQGQQWRRALPEGPRNGRGGPYPPSPSETLSELTARVVGASERKWESQCARDMTCTPRLWPRRSSTATLAHTVQCACMATLSPKPEGTPSCVHSDLGLERSLQGRAGFNKSRSLAAWYQG